MENFAFNPDPDALDTAGTAITLDATGTVFTINQAGLYHVEWSLNLQSGVQPIIVCLLENGQPASAISSTAESGNCSSGALLNVTASQLPFTVSLQSFGGAITIADPDFFEGTAASMRILRFAEGPSV